jgi:hypothetical protein
MALCQLFKERWAFFIGCDSVAILYPSDCSPFCQDISTDNLSSQSGENALAELSKKQETKQCLKIY